MKKLKELSAVVACLCLLMLTACGTNPDVSGNNNSPSDPEYETAQAINAVQTFSEAYEFADAIIRVGVTDSNAARPRTLGCMYYNQVALDTTSATRSLTLTFNSKACADGAYRSGKLIFNWTGSWSSSSRGQVTFKQVNYNVNGDYHRVRGTVDIVAGQASPTYTIAGTDSILYYNTIGTSLNNFTLTKVQTANGITTTAPNTYQTAFKVYGSGSGTSYRPRTFTFNIPSTTALTTLYNCGYFTTGALAVTPAGVSQRGFDFGTGTCDNYGTLTVDGVTYSVSFF